MPFAPVMARHGSFLLPARIAFHSLLTMLLHSSSLRSLHHRLLVGGSSVLLFAMHVYHSQEKDCGKLISDVNPEVDHMTVLCSQAMKKDDYFCGFARGPRKQPSLSRKVDRTRDPYNLDASEQREVGMMLRSTLDGSCGHPGEADAELTGGHRPLSDWLCRCQSKKTGESG